MSIVGWDIGAVNVKAACVARKDAPALVASQPVEIWREKERLRDVLQSVFSSVIRGMRPRAMAVTMTAELSDAFATKREGVLFILDSLQSCFNGMPVHIFSLSGKFVRLEEARTRPLDFAASNWLASAEWIAGRNPSCLVIDVGSTTTDILPIVDGQVRVAGRADPERLSSGELVYTGALRTNLAAIVSSVPVRGQLCRVSSEYFAISGDVHLILGNLNGSDYVCVAPDGRPPSFQSACARVARIVCADIEMLPVPEIVAMAGYIYTRQVQQICSGIQQVLSRIPSLRSRPAIVLGSGSFLGKAAAASLGLEIGKPPIELGLERLSVAPCVAVAELLADYLESTSQ